MDDGGEEATVTESKRARALPVEPDWFQRAVFYEVLVQSFFDSNDDGIGDLAGLTAKLDYLRWLGVDCLWVPPFFDSPRRDGGYDVRDYYQVSPDYGTLDDFVTLVDEAHARGIRVIVDLVLNHTSDTHRWFQESRRDPGGPFGDFYVWRDTDTDYAGVRVIFTDVEESNWSFDPVRRQFFWHRFYSHQPDLNYDNPAVVAAMLDVVRFWLGLGIDGFRLDAITYLYEREGTDCANLPETHQFLKRVRALVDDEFPGRVILAEANLWPAELVDYFGAGDECHMAFHFPLMPRLFLALKQEDSAPISAILRDTPALPPGCQWGTFLRNHDELTLEMVTPEERAFLHEHYAAEPRAILNLGLRRRLAPLVAGDRGQLRLLTSLLLTLPGSPVLYFGDEIGMGDNIWLADRDGVRTPMQWSVDRNGGFSRADPHRLALPVNIDWVYGYGAVNVERQLAEADSQLHWTRQALALRRRSMALTAGDFEELDSGNPAVLAFLRRHPDEVVLCVHNLSASPQPAKLDLARFGGHAPVELTGGVTFPAIGDEPFPLTLPRHGSLLFSLVPAHRPTVPAHRPTAPAHRPAVPAVPAIPAILAVPAIPASREPVVGERDNAQWGA